MQLPKYFAFWFFALILICFHLFAFTGHFGYDDLHYAKLAKRFLDGQIDYTDHYAYRWTTITYLSLFYRYLGINDFSIACSALSVSIATLYISYLLLKELETKIIFFSLSIQVLGSWYLFYTDKLTPDIYVLFFATLSIFFISRQRFCLKKPSTLLNAAGLAMALCLGFLSKETILIAVPAILFFAISDWIQQKNRLFWLSSASFGLLFLSAYFYFILRITGSVFSRFSAIQSGAYFNLCSYDVQNSIFLIRRITYEFIELFIQTGAAIPLVFLVSYLSRNSFPFWKPENKQQFYVVLCFFLLLTGNFMPTSLKSYSPICLDIRHFLMLMPPLAIVAGFGLKEYLSAERSNFSIVRWLFLLTVISFFFDSKYTFTLYMPFAILWLLHGLSKNAWIQRTFIVLLFLIQLQAAFEWIIYARGLKYENQKEDIIQLLNRYPKDTLITDEVQKRLIYFYEKFDSGSYHPIQTYDQVDAKFYTNKIIYSNWYTQYLSGMQNANLPLWMRLNNDSKRILFRDSPLGIEAFRFSKMIDLKTLFKDSFGYEAQQKFWTFHEDSRESKFVFSGNYSERINTYSATFEFPVDSFHLSGTGQWIIRARTRCKMKDHAEVKLVVEISSPVKNLFWKGEDCNHFMKAYGLWWEIKNELILNQSDFMHKQAKVKIYVWMNSKTEVFLDDWLVEVDSAQ